MTPTLDIWRCAKLMIDQHGDNAQLKAIDKAALMVGQGDMAGQRTWLRILKAIDEMRTVGPGQVIH